MKYQRNIVYTSSHITILLPIQHQQLLDQISNSQLCLHLSCKDERCWESLKRDVTLHVLLIWKKVNLFNFFLYNVKEERKMQLYWRTPKEKNFLLCFFISPPSSSMQFNYYWANAIFYMGNWRERNPGVKSYGTETF